jgi:heme/copper-type cytochrome/quinol oxidase subunit 3
VSTAITSVALDPPRPSAPAPILATMFLIAGDLMFFAGLIFAFWVLRLAAPVWPPPLQPRLPIGVTTANTFVLLASSAAMLAATRTLARGRGEMLTRRLGLAALLGGFFVTLQGYEWARLVGFGLTVSSGIYGALFYTLVGAHALHVAAALVWVAVTAIRARRGRLDHTRVAEAHACALYWHFVVALWPLLYVSVYLV